MNLKETERTWGEPNETETNWGKPNEPEGNWKNMRETKWTWRKLKEPEGNWKNPRENKITWRKNLKNLKETENFKQIGRTIRKSKLEENWKNQYKLKGREEKWKIRMLKNNWKIWLS
jgi:hypothetical protein